VCANFTAIEIKRLFLEIVRPGYSNQTRALAEISRGTLGFEAVAHRPIIFGFVQRHPRYSAQDRR